MAQRRRDHPQVVLAIDMRSLTLPALEAAVALGAGLGSELLVLFGADASLPAEADHLRRIVARMAAQFGLEWAFDRAAGDLVAAAFDRLRPADALVMQRGPPASFPIGATVPFAALDARPVLVLFDHSENAERALAAGHAMARVIHTELAVLVAADGANGSLRRRAEHWLAGRGGSARFVSIASSAVSSVARLANELRAGALVGSGLAAGAAPVPFARLLDRLDCPLVVLAGAALAH